MATLNELVNRFKKIPPSDANSADQLKMLFEECRDLGETIDDSAARNSLQQLTNLVADQLYFLTKSRPTDQRIREALKPLTLRKSTRKIEPGNLPDTSPLLVGREEERKQLHTYWQTREVNVVTIVGSGGSGKTSLVSHWLGELARQSPAYRDAANVFIWHFAQASDDVDFLEEAATFFQLDLDHASALDERWRRLADVIGKDRNLLVLDQLEVLQTGPPKFGSLPSHLAGFLRRLAAKNDGLCVITTRFAIPNLASWNKTTAPVMELPALSNEAGAQLLEKLKVHGTPEELEQASADYSGHALALTLLGNYLRLAHEGDVRRREKVVLLDPGDAKGSLAEVVCANYEKWFAAQERGQVDLAIMRLFGLFPGPLVLEQFRLLAKQPQIPGLNDQLVGVTELEINRALERLEHAGLLTRRVGTRASWPPFEEVLDAHPLVREYFGSQLSSREPEAWKKGHERLYEYLRAKGPLKPETLDQMRPIYHAIVHACLAGKYRDGLSLYQSRLRRGDEWYSAKKVAAFSYELMVMSKFFTDDYVTLVQPRPKKSFDGQDRFTIYMSTARALRAQKRLADAGRLFDEASQIVATLGQWVSVMANWCEVEFLQGNIPDAREMAERIHVKGTQRKNAELITTGLVHLAIVDWKSGNVDVAMTRFAEARKSAPNGELPLMDGCWECEAELDLAVSVALQERLPTTSSGRKKGSSDPASRLNEARTIFASVRMRAERLREMANATSRPVEAGRYQLEVGRSLMLEAIYCCLSPADQAKRDRLLEDAAPHLEKAVFALQESQQHLVSAILWQATLNRLQGDWKVAESMLTEAKDLALAGGVSCYLPDIFLELAHLELDRGNLPAARENLRQSLSSKYAMPGYGRLTGEISMVDARLVEAGQH